MDLEKCMLKLKDVSVILSDKYDVLLDFIPQSLRNEFIKCSFIAGGCIYDLYNDKEPRDYDFFLTKESFKRELLDFFNTYVYRDIYKENSKLKTGQYKGCEIIITDNAVSIKNCYGNEFQIVLKYIGELKEVVLEFDFLNNMFYYQYESNEVKTVSFFRYLETNKLHFNMDRSRDIANCIARIGKLSDKGFRINKSEINKMLYKLYKNGFTESEIDSITNNRTY